MDVVSLGYRTDLALLALSGSTIADRGDHLVVRTADNPNFWWGNFILLERPPEPGEGQRWVDRFHEEFPHGRHLAIGVDAPAGTAEDLQPFADLGLKVETSSVMTARSVHAPPRPNTEAEYRMLESDEDWAAQVDLRMTIDEFDEVQDLDRHRVFVKAKSDSSRELSRQGHGAWFGAFIDGRLLSTMGLVRADGDLGRFQSVETHPQSRGQGLAGTLVHHVSRYGFEDLGARTLVMVADPDYLAIRIYRVVGFTSSEVQLQVSRT